jgi:23S rRNA pseudouridine1911/1915/1917 synthase
MQARTSFQADDPDARRRLDLVVTERVGRLSRSRVRDLIKTGHIKLNGQRARPSQAVRAGDLITVTEPELVPVTLNPAAIPLQFLFDDEHLAVINKPAGLAVHPGAGQPDGTLVNALLYHCRNLSGIGGELRPGVVHRLDKETSGCLVIAKTDRVHQRLSRQFADRQVEKLYFAICAGIFRQKSGEIREPIGRHPVHRQKMAIQAKGRPALTRFQVIKELNGNTAVLCRLLTGRTHQIRVHFQHLGHPILGDKVYGRRASGDRLMLHSWRLAFTHPETEKWVEFTAEIPQEFGQVGVNLDELLRSGPQFTFAATAER